MRKRLLAFLLPVILLLSQQGAVTHEIGHVADFVARAQGGSASASVADAARILDAAVGAERGAAGDRGEHRAGDLQCQACLAFAHLAGVVTAQVVPPVLSSFGFHFAVIEAPAFVAADAPTARSRGPPILLNAVPA